MDARFPFCPPLGQIASLLDGYPEVLEPHINKMTPERGYFLHSDKGT